MSEETTITTPETPAAQAAPPTPDALVVTQAAQDLLTLPVDTPAPAEAESFAPAETTAEEAVAAELPAEEEPDAVKEEPASVEPEPAVEEPPEPVVVAAPEPVAAFAEVDPAQDAFEEEEVEDEEPEPDAEPVAVAAPAAEESAKKWYVVKVQSNREDTIKEAIERRVKKEGLEEFYGQIVIPVEKYTEVKQDKNGRKVTRTKERKLYPGYLFVEVEYNDRILYLFRETSGVGDFVGSHPNKLERPPTPMSDTEVLRMVGPQAAGIDPDVPAVPAPPKGMGVGDRVKVVDGTFNGMEGVVKQIMDTVGKVQVEVSIFGRPVGVELDYYQVEEI